MIVVVAEKPSVARDIARVLGCKKSVEGYIAGDKYTITWALGHLVTLCEPQEIDERYKKWRMEDLPILPETIPTKVISKTRSQYAVVKKLLNDKATERVICATDAGREGELIFRLIYEKTGCKKPVDRLWISSMTDAAIREGFDNLQPNSAYQGLYQSALCRSQADWLVGMNASRAYTLRYDALLSIGRVQTPTLAVLVKRADEIEAFVPESYFTLTADFGEYSGQWFDPACKEDNKKHRIPNEETAKGIAQGVRKKQATVQDILTEKKREVPPLLYDLTSLQRDANRLLNFTAKKTLEVAQNLYERHKAITYPRTDSRYLPNDMVKVVEKTMGLLPPRYDDLVTGVPRTGGKLAFTKRIYDDSKVSDHHAIIPTSQKANMERMHKDENELYDLIVRRFLAAFYPAHEFEQVKVITVSENQYFLTTGKTILAIGWKATDRPSKTERESLAPKVNVGDVSIVKSVKIKQDSTKPPSPHTDSSLLSAMENAGREVEEEELRESMKGSGLGTPATRAAIIERLIKVGYVQRRGKSLYPTDKGIKLIRIVPDDIASPVLTGKWEKALSEIAQGKRETERFMQGIRSLSTYLVTSAQTGELKTTFEKEVRGKRTSKGKTVAGVKCPLCGGKVIENQKAFGCENWRTGCKLTFWKTGFERSSGPKMTEKLLKILLTKGEAVGSTGAVRLQDGMISFTPLGKESPVSKQSIEYHKK
ncbi:MAG TPA: DNA topoisomerase III [Clostridiales bacterium]|jgi:DNA topoisomerase-3|nr:DNA topoisomerase III [Clostridiales bacterium]